MSTSTLAYCRGSILTPERPDCTAPRHNPTNTTWLAGCRCPGAEAAHDAYLKRRAARAHELRARAALARAGVCGAVTHNSLRAWELGCRCLESERARKRRLENMWRRRMSGAARRARLEKKTQQYRERDAADPFVIETLAQGTRVAGARTSEIIAAIDRLRRRNVPNGPRRWSPMNAREMGEILGISQDEVYRLQQVRANWGVRRVKRRLIQSQMRALVVADAVGQKRQRALRHEVMAAAGEKRRTERALTWKQHCRTMRRLRESQERAKVVALAVQRRGREWPTR